MIKCDLHIHSKYSFDALAKPKDIADIAIKRGIQCAAIADHGNIRGALEAQKYVQEKNLPILIIISEEVKTKSGDILAYNVKESIPEHLPVGETIKLIHQQGGLAVIAHPFGSWCGFKDDLKKYIGLLDGIEVSNASVFWGNKKAQNFAQEYGLAFTAGSDAHFTNQFIAKAWLELPLDYSPSLTADDVIAAIKQKRGQLGGRAANFFEKSLDHSFRTLTKLKILIKQKKR
jgi:predicted metal-dependent phosphoesterase TrpH